MSCAAHDDALALLVSDDLADGPAQELHHHLARCTECRARLEEYRSDAAWLRRQRSTPPDTLVAEQLRARIADQIAAKPPASWTMAWLQRLLEGVRRGPQPMLAGLAVALLLVGAVGALTRPLGRDRVASGLEQEYAGTLPGHGHRHVDLESHGDEELAFDSDGVEPGSEETSAGSEPDVVAGAKSSAGAEATQEEQELAAPTPGAMRIEMKTSDPDVRIIWFAEADRAESAWPRRP